MSKLVYATEAVTDYLQISTLVMVTILGVATLGAIFI